MTFQLSDEGEHYVVLGINYSLAVFAHDLTRDALAVALEIIGADDDGTPSRRELPVLAFSTDASMSATFRDMADLIDNHAARAEVRVRAMAWVDQERRGN